MFGLPQQFMDWLQTFDKNILTYIKFCAVAILKPITGLFSKKEVNLPIAYINRNTSFWLDSMKHYWKICENFCVTCEIRAGVSTA